MADYDKKLGFEVHDMLVEKKLETPYDAEYSGRKHNQDTMAKLFEQILDELGMDGTNDSISGTPKRIAKMFREEIFYGLDYNKFPSCMNIENEMSYEGMVLSKNILVRSVCEHHFVPFIGRAHVAYIPNKKVIGLSKLNRIVDFFSRRPQVQERLNEQVAHTLAHILGTEDVAVVIDCEHFCVKLRGVEDPHSSTITSKVLGKFRTEAPLRNEFMQLATMKCS